MKIQPDEFYLASSEELQVIGRPQTLARYRHEGIGPAYVKLGKRILYKGSDLIQWLENRRVAAKADAQAERGHQK